MTTPKRDHALAAAKLVCMVGPVVACLLAWRFGWNRGHDWFDSLGQGFGFAAASLMVGYGGILILMSYMRRIWPLVAVFGVIWTLSFLAETTAHVGVLASNNAATQNTAVMSKARYESAQKGLQVAQADVDRLQAEVAKEPALSADVAQGEIDRAKSHRFWGVTNGCVETKGPQTREFCAKFFAARAALGDHEKRSAKLAELQAARERLAAAQGAAGETKITTAAAGAQSWVLAQVLTTSLKPSDSATEATNIAAVILLALVFVSFGLGNTGLWYLTHGRDAVPMAEPSSVPNREVRSAPVVPAGVTVLGTASPRDSHAVKTLASLMERRAAA